MNTQIQRSAQLTNKNIRIHKTVNLHISSMIGNTKSKQLILDKVILDTNTLQPQANQMAMKQVPDLDEPESKTSLYEHLNRGPFQLISSIPTETISLFDLRKLLLIPISNLFILHKLLLTP